MGNGEWGIVNTNYQLPITNYQLPITNYQLPITNYQLCQPICHTLLVLLV
ncbi:MAG: alpha/beta hydrolase [Scytonematopsis contorta HA4267-MV1]|nr:alpha/beta hydrolase [Scytonematopsis contorta HA4267-MV1]